MRYALKCRSFHKQMHSKRSYIELKVERCLTKLTKHGVLIPVWYKLHMRNTMQTIYAYHNHIIQ